MGSAIESVLAQSCGDFEFIVVRDGGERIDDIVRRFDDPRIVFIDRDENRGKAYSLNEAVKRVRGKYVAYIDDDDIYYPNHLQVLVESLEGQDEYEVAYSDLYKVHCRVMPDGERVVLSKNVEVSRDFDRMTMLMFNHVLHVSVMHRRELLEKVGPYNESLKVMIDWDLTRRLAFFSDFKHVRVITGEYYGPVGDCDRISVVHRKDVNGYIRHLLTIRSSRPAKPWPKVGDLSIIVLAGRADGRLEQFVSDIWSHTICPYQIYLPLGREELARFRTIVPNVIGVPVEQGSSDEQKIDAVLNCCSGDYVGVVPCGFNITGDSCAHGDDVAWIEKSGYALSNSNPNK